MCHINTKLSFPSKQDVDFTQIPRSFTTRYHFAWPPIPLWSKKGWGSVPHNLVPSQRIVARNNRRTKLCQRILRSLQHIRKALTWNIVLSHPQGWFQNGWTTTEYDLTSTAVFSFSNFVYLTSGDIKIYLLLTFTLIQTWYQLIRIDLIQKGNSSKTTVILKIFCTLRSCVMTSVSLYQCKKLVSMSKEDSASDNFQLKLTKWFNVKKLI